MRTVVVSAAFALAALVLAPVAGATCHFCAVTDPVQELMHHFLP